MGKWDHLFRPRAVSDIVPEQTQETRDSELAYAEAEDFLRISQTSWFKGYRKGLDEQKDTLLRGMAQSSDITLGRIRQLLIMAEELDSSISEAQEVVARGTQRED